MSGALPQPGGPPAPGGVPGMPPGGAAPGGMPSAPGLPPGMSGPRPNVGPVAQAQGNPGNLGAALLDVRNGVQFLQRALPNLPMGSPLWKDIYDALGKISKHAQSDSGPTSLLNQSAMSLIRERSQNPQSAAFGRMFPQPAQPPAMPQAPPAGAPPE